MGKPFLSGKSVQIQAGHLIQGALQSLIPPSRISIRHLSRVGRGRLRGRSFR